jgi:WD40 repeat protein
MGAVYRAEDATGQPVALKVMKADADPVSLERFHREARVAAEVRHPNVVSVFASGGDAHAPFLALELVEGGTLRDLLKREGRLDWRRAVMHGAEIARGLAAIHASGLVHRDLKPDNVLLAPTGAKVSDLGLARRASTGLSTEGLTRTGELLGTVEYMAPEQLEDAKRADARADLYALGASLYALLTGAPPFQGRGPGLMKRVFLESPRPPSALAPDIPDALDALVLSLLAKSPANRPPDASAVARELEAIASGAGPAKRRSPLLFAIAGGALVLVTLAGSWLARGSTPEPVATTPALPTPAPERRTFPAECHGFLATRIARLAAVSGRYVDRHPADRSSVPILGVSISSDGKRCATIGCPNNMHEQGTAAVWDLATKRVLRRFGGPGDTVFDAAFLPDGEHVVTGAPLGDQSPIKVRSLRDGEPDRVVGRSHTFTIAVSPRGRRIASASDRGVQVFDAAGGKNGMVLPQGSAPDRIGCGRAAFLTDDRILVACDDGIARIWDVSKGYPDRVKTLEGHEPSQNMPSLALSRDGRFALTASVGRGGELRLWNLGSNESESFTRTDYPAAGIRSLAFAATRHLALVSPAERHDNRLETLDTKTGERSWISTLGGDNNAVAVTPDERLAVCGDQHGTLRIVDLERRLDVEPGHVLKVTGVGFLPDGKRVASTGFEGVLRVWDERGGLVACLNGPERRDRIVQTMNALAVSPNADDGRFATPFYRESRALAVFAVGRDGPLPLAFDSPQRNVLSAAYSPDGQKLVSGDDNGGVQVWNAETGQPRGEPLAIPGSKVFVNSVAYSPDGGRILASATRGGVRVWNAVTREMLGGRALADEPGGPPIVSAFAGRERIVVGGGSGSLAVWDLAGGSWREVGRHDSGANPCDGNAPTSVIAVAASDDGRRAVSAGEDGRIRIWDLAASKELDRIDLRSSEDVATALAIGHDGRTLAVGTRRGLVLRFDLTDR